MDENKARDRTFELLEDGSLNWTLEKRRIPDLNRYGLYKKDGTLVSQIAKGCDPLQNYVLIETLVHAMDAAKMEILSTDCIDDSTAIVRGRIGPATIGRSDADRTLIYASHHQRFPAVDVGVVHQYTDIPDTLAWMGRSIIDLLPGQGVIQPRIDAAVGEIGRHVEMDAQRVRIMKNTAMMRPDHSLVQSILMDVIRNVYDVDTTKPVSKTAEGLIRSLASSMADGAPVYGGTVWGVMRSIVSYASSIDTRPDSALFGNGAKVANQTWDTIASRIIEDRKK